MVLRHGATAYGYTDAIWKYGKSMGGGRGGAAAANQCDTGDRKQPGLAGGVHSSCAARPASNCAADRGVNGDADATMKK
jgi:hypothetical protein